MTPSRILVLCTRRLGDVLLTTPLIRSLRRAWPAVHIEVLTLAGSAAALTGNPDINGLITLRERAPLGETLKALGGPRRYDLALSTLYNDRPHLLAWWSAPRRANVLPPPGEPGRRWKRLLSQHTAGLEPVHTVVQYLRLADALGIARCADVVPPQPADEGTVERWLGPGWRARPHAVVHPAPLYEYKAWTLEGWRRIVRWLSGQGLRVVVSGGPAPGERAYAGRVAEGATGVVDVSGQLQLAELSPVLAGARAYVGPDTSVTHLAAATGAPTVALFGPSNPVVWGPWPQGYRGPDPGPWVLQQPLQQCGNVWLLQGLAPCTPCLLEGCERRLDSRSRCLDELPAARVLASVRRALESAR